MDIYRNTLEIKSFHMKEFFDKTGITHQELGLLLNVSPISIRRWEDDSQKAPDPTSTAFLVLIPLLLAAGVDILPPPDESAVAMQISMHRAMGASEEDLQSEETRQTIRKGVSLMTTPEVNASRTLFKALSEAWRKIDDSSTPAPKKK